MPDRSIVSSLIIALGITLAGAAIGVGLLAAELRTVT
jgi:hypothetical protein